jgi:hypothetical protein
MISLSLTLTHNFSLSFIFSPPPPLTHTHTHHAYIILPARTKKVYPYNGAYLENGKWTSQIRLGRQQYRLGRFETEAEAAHAYDLIAKELPNRRLNFRKFFFFFFCVLFVMSDDDDDLL